MTTLNKSLQTFANICISEPLRTQACQLGKLCVLHGINIMEFMAANLLRTTYHGDILGYSFHLNYVVKTSTELIAEITKLRSIILELRLYFA